jgi:molybdopterin converting factor small subunit
MKVTIKYFGLVAEAAGRNEESFHFEGPLSSGDLKQKCLEQFTIQDKDSIQVAVNQNLDETIVLKDGDEVALLPPFAGG